MSLTPSPTRDPATANGPAPLLARARGLGALFLVLLAAVMLAIAAIGHSERAELLGYVALLIVGPFAAGAVALFLDGWRPGWTGSASGVVVLTALFGFAGLTSAALIQQFAGWPATGIWLQIACLLVLLLGGWAVAWPEPRRWPRAWFPTVRNSRILVPLVLAVSILFFAVYSPLYPEDPRFAAVMAWSIEHPLFIVLFVVGWGAVLALICASSRVNRPRLSRLALWVAMTIAVLLYDDGQFVVHDHYQPYIGPALFSRAGGIPMVEVYSQYGFLPWVLVQLAYEWLPPTFGTFGMIYRLFTVAWFAVFVLSVFRLVDNKVQGCLLAITGLFWVVTFHINIFNLNGLPSAQGYRYLVPALMILALISEDGLRRRALPIALVSGLAALWSAEAFVFSIGSVAALAMLETIRDRSLRTGLRTLGPAIMGAVISHGLLVVYLLSVHEAFPDYGPYLSIVGEFQPGADNEWVVLINPYFGLWVPVAFVLFLPLAAAMKDALAGEVSDRRAWSLVPAAVLGVAQLSYFVGRSTETTLGLVLVPFLIVVIAWLDDYPAWFAQRRGWARWLECGLLAALIAAAFAFSSERISRPYEESRATANVLRRCFTDVGCSPPSVLNRILWNVNTFGRSMNDQDPRYAVVEGKNLQARVIELERTIRDFYAGDGERVPLLVDTLALPYVGILALADTGNWYLWPMSSPLNDFKSTKLFDRVIHSTKQLAVNDAVIIDRRPDELLPEMRHLLEALEARCTLRPIQIGKFYEVRAVESCRDGG